MKSGNIKDNPPDEIGLYKGKMVKVWTRCTGHQHGSQDYYDVYITDMDENFLEFFEVVKGMPPKITTRV